MVGFFFSSRRRHTRFKCDWSSDVCSSDLLRAKGYLESGIGLITNPYPKAYPNPHPNPNPKPKLPLTASASNRFPKH